MASSSSALRATCTSTPSSPRTRASAWAPSGPGLSGSIGVEVSLPAPSAMATATAATRAAAIRSVERCRRKTPGWAAGADRSVRRWCVIAVTTRSSSSASTAPACSRVAGRSPYSTSSKSRRAPVHAVGQSRRTPWPGPRRPRGRWRPGCRAAGRARPGGRRAPGTPRPRPPRTGPPPAPSSARARSSVGGDDLLGQDRALLALLMGGTTGTGQQPARAPRPARRRPAWPSTSRGRTRPRGRVQSVADLAEQPVEELLEQVLLVVLGVQQLAPQLGAGLVEPDGSSGGSGSRATRSRTATRMPSRGGDPGLLHQLDVVGLLAHPLVEVLERGHRRR